MKRITIILCLLWSIVSYASSQEKVINQPPLMGWSSSSIEVDKVVLSDTATVLHIKAFYRPRFWIKIASGSFLKSNDGELYRLRRGIGITPDQEFWMPESGTADFALVFPPLPAHVTSVDFSEGDTKGSYQLWGIQLDGKLPTLNLPKEATKRTKKLLALPAPIIAKEKGVLEGKLLNFVPGMERKLELYLNNPYDLQQKVEIALNEDGSFSSEVPLILSTPAAIYLYDQAIPLFLAPGETTQIYINNREIVRRASKLNQAKEYSEEIAYYGGYLAELCREIGQSHFTPDIDHDFKQFLPNLKDKDANEVKTYLLNQRQEKLQAIDKLKVSKTCKEFFRLSVDASTVTLLSNTTRIMSQAVMMTNRFKNREEMTSYFKEHPIILPQEYYDCLTEFTSLSSPTAIYVSKYSQLTTSTPLQTYLSKALGSKQGLFFELSTVNAAIESINEFNPLTDEQIAAMKTLSHPVFWEMVKEKNNELLATIERNKKKDGFNLNEAGEVSNEQLFASILSKFRGQVVLVDFWATWCGPCRMANKEMIPMKEELKEREITYLYITNESSPKGTWENMITDIHGEHYRLTNDQWNYLSKEFRIEGVPTYVIVDREGNVTYKNVGFSGVDSIKKELLKALEKK